MSFWRFPLIHHDGQAVHKCRLVRVQLLASSLFLSLSSSKNVPHPEDSDARVCLSCTVVTKSIISSLHINNSLCFCTQACSSRDMQLFSLQIRQEVSLCSGVRPESPQWPLEIEQVHGNV